MKSNYYPGFAYSAEVLSAYVFSIDVFILSLVSEEIVRFTCDEPEQFQAWLQQHGVRNINDAMGDMVRSHYFKKK